MSAAGPTVGGASASLRRTCSSAEEARALAAAIAPENSGYVEATAVGRELRIEARGRNEGELRRTLDDLLACVSAAERTWAAAHGAGSAPPSAEDDEERDA